ncbi:MAG TPA: hypothetical protein VLB07_16075 [Woeseiaceae bacterium]|nr:hypothetical protein [Woeseiaceae bacterium]
MALLLIAVVLGQARGNVPQQGTSESATSRPVPQSPLSPAENDRPTARSSLMDASVQLVLFGIDTFLESHGQGPADDQDAEVSP